MCVMSHVEFSLKLESARVYFILVPGAFFQHQACVIKFEPNGYRTPKVGKTVLSF